MPRENSFSDSEGRSLTPDLEDDYGGNDDQAFQDDGIRPSSPTYSARHRPQLAPVLVEPHAELPKSSFSIKSRPSNVSPSKARPTLANTMRPSDRFRSAAKKVMALHRSTTMIRKGQAGAEPGVDPRRASADLLYADIKQDCVIELFDYSSVRQSQGKMTNREFVELMDNAQASEPEKWSRVRWVNIGGMSWDVMKAVSLRYNLHPLALEDVFHARRQTRSKADYYSQHLFLRILCHELADEDEKTHPHLSAAFGSTLTGAPRTTSPEPLDDSDYGMSESKTIHGTFSGASTLRKGSILPFDRGDVEQQFRGRKNKRQRLFTPVSKIVDPSARKEAKRLQQAAAIDVLKGKRVDVKVTPMYIFLLRDNTVISIHNTPTGRTDFTKPIVDRLQSRDSVLRKTADPSLLVHSLIDLIVDKALEVTDEYHMKIDQFERQILLRPKMETVKELHILSGDLILHKRTLEPIKQLVYGLRRYDLDRCAALVDTSTQHKEPIVGYMSHRSKIYLADVHDHMEYILTSLDMFSSIGENLIAYAFNMTSWNMNEVMRQLTLCTIIFLPMTLLTGYFGMNFDPMWSVQQNSDLLFWEIAIPVLTVVTLLFLMPDIKRFAHYLKKRMMTSSALKALKLD